jgi:hypothetical protein
MIRILKSLILVLGRIFAVEMNRLIDFVREPKLNFENIVAALFYCALFGSIGGTIAIERDPARYGIWWILVITGVSYGYLLSTIAVVCSMVVWGCWELIGGALDDFRSLTCLYIGAVTGAYAVSYWVVVPLAGTAVSVIAFVTVLQILGFGYCHDYRTSKLILQRKLRLAKKNSAHGGV